MSNEVRIKATEIADLKGWLQDSGFNCTDDSYIVEYEPTIESVRNVLIEMNQEGVSAISGEWTDKYGFTIIVGLQHPSEAARGLVYVEVSASHDVDVSPIPDKLTLVETIQADDDHSVLRLIGTHTATTPQEAKHVIGYFLNKLESEKYVFSRVSVVLDDCVIEAFL